MHTKLYTPSFISYYDRSGADNAISLLYSDDDGVHGCLFLLAALELQTATSMTAVCARECLEMLENWVCVGLSTCLPACLLVCLARLLGFGDAFARVNEDREWHEHIEKGHRHTRAHTQKHTHIHLEPALTCPVNPLGPVTNHLRPLPPCRTSRERAGQTLLPACLVSFLSDS